MNRQTDVLKDCGIAKTVQCGNTDENYRRESDLKFVPVIQPVLPHHQIEYT